MSNNKTDKKVAIYCRVGRPEQLIDSNSLIKKISLESSKVKVNPNSFNK